MVVRGNLAGIDDRLVLVVGAGPTGLVLALSLARLVPWIVPLLFRLASVRRWLFRTVSQTGVNYRNSPLSVGTAGGVRGGDRLPWFGTGAVTDNFTPLTSLTWQVHVYGELRSGLAAVCDELQLPLHQFAWQPGMRRNGVLLCGVTRGNIGIRQGKRLGPSSESGV